MEEDPASKPNGIASRLPWSSEQHVEADYCCNVPKGMIVRDKVALSQCHYKYSPEYLLWGDASENIFREFIKSLKNTKNTKNKLKNQWDLGVRSSEKRLTKPQTVCNRKEQKEWESPYDEL